MQHADGEILAARAARTFGVPFTLSTMSICSIEDVAEHAGPGFWFQLYVMRDRDYIERLIDRAKAAGCSGAAAHARPADPRPAAQGHQERPVVAPKPTLSNLINLATMMSRAGAWACWAPNAAASATSSAMPRAWATCRHWPRGRWSSLTRTGNWGDVEWIKKRWGGKLIIKGIMDAEDARPRQTAAPTPSSSATTAAASSTAPFVDPRCRHRRHRGQDIEVLMDGGIRSGQDVLKARALVRRAPDRPRLPLRPGAYGELGVTHLLEIIPAKGLDLTMAFCGRTDINTVDEASCCRAPTRGSPGLPSGPSAPGRVRQGALPFSFCFKSFVSRRYDQCCSTARRSNNDTDDLEMESAALAFLRHNAGAFGPARAGSPAQASSNACVPHITRKPR